ncbi:D-alanyl-D-alanine carboxypeptidase family protein [Hartmannibacter diazotrophicus]|nr:D-alanyl-D-alanine carboxypeptidase family protein [Hartmannibacter diazotrophicus]
MARGTQFPKMMQTLSIRSTFLLRRLLAAFLVALTLAVPQAARAAAWDNAPYLLFDVRTGEVLAERNAFAPWYPASVTKLMTAYVVFDAIKRGEVSLMSPVTVSAHANAQAPSKMGFQPGTQITLDNALKMMIVKSANDIAMAIAETIGGSQAGFAARMNDTARRLGMTGSRFDNPNGLPDKGQWMTARDLAILTRALIRDFPQYDVLFRIPAISIGDKVLKSQNKLLEQYPGADGMKTGFICSAGFNMVASATRGGRRLVVVVLGQPNTKVRNETAARLLESGFGRGAKLFDRKVTLDRLAPSGRVPSHPVDLRPDICGPNGKIARSIKPVGTLVLAPTTAEPAPVPVAILGTGAPLTVGDSDDEDDGTDKTTLAGAVAVSANVPLPRLRPMAPVRLKGTMSDPALPVARP